MNDTTFDAFNQQSPSETSLDFLIGDWDVCETHALIHRANAEQEGGWMQTSSRLAKGWGKASGGSVFGKLGVHYQFSSEGYFHPTGREAERTLHSQAVVFLQVTEESVTGAFHLPQSLPLCLTGRVCGHSVAFRAETIWPCSTLLAHLLQNHDGLSHWRVIVVIRPLNEGIWMLAVYHISLFEPDFTVVLISSFVHRRHFDAVLKMEPSVHPDSAEKTYSQPSATALPQTERRLSVLDLEDELDRAREALAQAVEEFEQITDDRDSSESEVIDAEFDWLALGSGESPQIDGLAAVEVAEESVCSKYREYLDLGEQHSVKEGEVASLEDDVCELEDLLENGIHEWQEARVREAERIVGETIDIVELPSVDLAEFQYVARYCVSDDVLTLLRTVLVLRKKFMAPHGDLPTPLDYSPLIGAMAKTCERLFGDAFSARRNGLTVPEVSQVLKNPKQFEFDIPAEDQEHKIDKSSLCKVLNMIEKGDSSNWSGTRNAAVALLLFGRHHRPTNHSSIEICNPLGLGGTDHDRTKLRVALYQLQTSRNGFIHHDVASLDDAKQFEALFVECARGLVELLYSKK